MNDAIKILKEKISQVENDIERVVSEQGTERQRVSMQDYLEYLKDELRMLERNERKL
jgi:hydrogenase maturation factor